VKPTGRDCPDGPAKGHAREGEIKKYAETNLMILRAALCRAVTPMGGTRVEQGEDRTRFT